MQKDLYNRLLEFELDNDIFDTSKYDRTIEHVKEELKTPKDIKQYINYYNLVLVAEEDSDDELCQKLEGFIDELSNLLSEREKQLKIKNKEKQERYFIHLSLCSLFNKIDKKLQVLAENSMESLVLLLDDIKARKIIRSYIQEWEYVSFLYYKLRCIKWNRK